MNEFLKKDLDLWVFGALLAIPAALWFTGPVLEPRFSSIEVALPNLGEMFGVIGAIMLSVNIILSTRLRWLEKILGGLNNLYLKHSKIGQVAFMLLLFHPLLLIFRYATDFAEARKFLWFSESLERNLGIFALILMIVLIILTLYLKPKYNVWKWTHKFFGVAFLLGAIHAYLIPSYTNSSNPILRYYVLIFSSLGIISYSYRTLFGEILVKRYRYVVKKIDKLYDVTEVTLTPQGKGISFEPGQFVFISFKQKGLSKEAHPFSISSAPGENNLRITIKNLGDFTEKLRDTIENGTLAKIEGPFGIFSHQNALSKNQIWIAGGIGITPFLSMASALRREENYKIDLYYSIKRENEAVKLRELQDISKTLAGLGFMRVIPVYTEKDGYLSAEKIKEESGSFSGKEIFICAPPPMIHSIRGQLVRAGVPNNFIHSEEFNLD